MKISRIDLNGNLQQCDILHNFFIARTAKVISVGWDNVLKNYEHLDFFVQAKIKKVKVGYLPEVAVDHNRNPKDENYLSYRLDTKRYLDYFFKKYCIKRLTLFEKHYVIR